MRQFFVLTLGAYFAVMKKIKRLKKKSPNVRSKIYRVSTVTFIIFTLKVAQTRSDLVAKTIIARI